MRVTDHHTVFRRLLPETEVARPVVQDKRDLTVLFTSHVERFPHSDFRRHLPSPFAPIQERPERVCLRVVDRAIEPRVDRLRRVVEVAAIIDEAVRESGASEPRDMGAVMKLVIPKVKGRADGKLVSRIVQSRLKG